MLIKFVDLYSDILPLKKEVLQSIERCIDSSSFIGGAQVANFEKEFASFVGVDYCVGVGNGTDALEIALWALDLPKDSEVIVPANTYIASAEAISNIRLNVVFADCNSDYNISIESIKSLINDKTSAIMPVHLYGLPVDIKPILELAKKHNLKVIEDCSQAHGALKDGKKVGSFGDIATFSFYPSKNLGAFGDGGAVVTNSKILYERIKAYANHGIIDNRHNFIGRNSRLDGLQASILNIKLKHLDKSIKVRNNIASIYLKELSNVPIKLPIDPSLQCASSLGSWHLFVIRVDNQQELKKYLFDKGIECRIHYEEALPDTQAYSNISQNCSDFLACDYAKHIISLPMGEHLSNENVHYICECIKDYYKKIT